MSEDTKINARQMLFIEEYMLTLNGTESAKKAGYAKPTITASRLLSTEYTPHVALEVERRISLRAKKSELRAEDVLKEVYYGATRDVIDLCDENGKFILDDLRDIPERMRRCIDGIKIKQIYDAEGAVIGQEFELKLVSKVAMIELAMKHLGLLDVRGNGNTEGREFIDWDSLMENEPNEVKKIGNVIDV